MQSLGGRRSEPAGADERPATAGRDPGSRSRHRSPPLEERRSPSPPMIRCRSEPGPGQQPPEADPRAVGRPPGTRIVISPRRQTTRRRPTATTGMGDSVDGPRDPVGPQTIPGPQDKPTRSAEGHRGPGINDLAFRHDGRLRGWRSTTEAWALVAVGATSSAKRATIRQRTCHRGVERRLPPPNGRRTLATGGWDDQIALGLSDPNRNVHRLGAPLPPQPNETDAIAVLFSHDGRLLAAGIGPETSWSGMSRRGAAG